MNTEKQSCKDVQIAINKQDQCHKQHVKTIEAQVNSLVKALLEQCVTDTPSNKELGYEEEFFSEMLKRETIDAFSRISSQCSKVSSRFNVVRSELEEEQISNAQLHDKVKKMESLFVAQCVEQEVRTQKTNNEDADRKAHEAEALATKVKLTQTMIHLSEAKKRILCLEAELNTTTRALRIVESENQTGTNYANRTSKENLDLRLSIEKGFQETIDVVTKHNCHLTNELRTEQLKNDILAEKIVIMNELTENQAKELAVRCETNSRLLLLTEATNHV